jgi:FlaA1/EpsC-like NDP-sugar epimerase
MEFFSKLITKRIIPFLRKWRLVNLLLGALDIFAITFAFQLAYYINYRSIDRFFINEKNFLILFLAILPFWLIVLYFMNVTEIPRTKRYRVLFYEYLQSALAIGIMLLIIYFIFKMSWISRLFLIEFTLFGLASLLFVRVMEYRVFKRYRAQGYNFVNVVLIADESSATFIEKLIENKEWGYKIMAIFSTSQKLKEKYEKTIILLPENYITVLCDLMEKDIIDEVIYIKKKEIASEVRNIMRSCEELGVTFMLRQSDNKLNLTNAIKTNIENEKFLTFINVPSNTFALAIK